MAAARMEQGDSRRKNGAWRQLPQDWSMETVATTRNATFEPLYKPKPRFNLEACYEAYPLYSYILNQYMCHCSYRCYVKSVISCEPHLNMNINLYCIFNMVMLSL
jgi:hypothetical protein